MWKKVEADGLLDLHGAAPCPLLAYILDPNVAAAPKIVHVLLLGYEQPLESLVHYAIHRPLGAAAQFFGGCLLRTMVDNVLGELDRTTGLGIYGESNLAKVRGTGNFV